MLVLFETPSGYALFKVLDESKVVSVNSVRSMVSSGDSLTSALKLASFKKFNDAKEATEEIVSLLDSKIGKSLRSFLMKEVGVDDELLVADRGLKEEISKTLKLKGRYSEKNVELMRGMKTHIDDLLSGVVKRDEMDQMRLGISHNLGRYKLKFSVDKIDKMIVQAIHLLDDMEKELNIYSMRLKEWYGWHFPELAKLISKNYLYAKTVFELGDRADITKQEILDKFAQFLDEEEVKKVKDAAMLSMGTEINDQDLLHIKNLAQEVIKSSEYKESLMDYLKNRMNSIAPNLTHLVGDVVGARLIAHAGSLLNLAKAPSSTVQIYGAEKALFTALRSKQNTPKYGLIYNAKLVGAAPQSHKGKIARSLAAKCSLASRVDAFTQKNKLSIAVKSKDVIEKRIENLEKFSSKSFSGGSNYHHGSNRSYSHPAKFKQNKYQYNKNADSSNFNKRRRDGNDGGEQQNKRQKF